MEEYRIYSRSQKARNHRVNEDRFLFSEFTFMEDKKIRVLVVADGMGGLEEGEIAAEHAVLGFSRSCYEKIAEAYIHADAESFSMTYFADRLEEIVKSAISQANDAVCKGADSRVATGTTISVVCMIGSYAVAANVGDSPIYLYRSRTRELKMVSKLHTRAELDAEAGIYERYSPEYYENDHFVYHSLGEHTQLQQEDISSCIIGRLETGDLFLIGSDGAFGRMQESEIWELLDGCSREEEGFVLIHLFQAARMDKDDDQTAMLYVVSEV